MDFTILYPDFLKKAVTFSFDDGTFYDVFLVDLMKKYNLKCTFNINSGLFGATANLELPEKTIFHNRLSLEQSRQLYHGFEIASHSCHHPLLTNQPNEVLDREILDDVKTLNAISDKKIVGFVIPGGPHDEHLDDYLQDKFLYVRTAQSSYSYEIPNNFLPFNPTIFHLDKDFLKVVDEYSDYDSEDISWLYIWGHSYEFALDGVYENLVNACKSIDRQRERFYIATNENIIDYVVKARKLRFIGNTFINDSNRDIYVECKGKKIIVKSNDVYKIYE